VLSAVEGLQVATPALGNAVIPITVGLLIALFAVQFKGTSRIWMVFGPILLVWFVVIAMLGASQIEQHPEVLAAFNPIYGLDFLRHAGPFDALLILGALMLVVTGSEAMYADVGHFGARPIRASWFAVVYPALLLNYLGQGAFLLTGAPIAGGKLFYSLVPPSMLYPMILLAIVAMIIASQALISGVFSLCLTSDPTGSLSAPRSPAHSSIASRSDLCPLYQSIAFCRMHPARLDVRLQFGADSAPLRWPYPA
jgi:KUP system potassium uptake protein